MRTVMPWLASALLGWIGLAGCDAPPSPVSESAAPPPQTQTGKAPQAPATLPPEHRTPPADAPRNESGIAWQVLSPGTGKQHPTPSHHVTFHVTGWQGDGRLMVDSRARGEPTGGPMGRNFKSWVQALGMMVEGEKRRYWIPVEEFHYGEPAQPGTLLVFDIELLEIGQLNRPGGGKLSPEQLGVVDAFNRLYAGTHIESRNITWMGVEIQQNPCDLIMMQQIIYELRPDLIIETGTYTGGGAFYYATLLELIDPTKGKVVTVDIKPMVDEVAKRPAFAKRVEVITGDSVSDETIAKLTAYANKAETVLVTLDSLHTAEHVAKELERYAPLVTKGSYLVVQDTYIKDFFPGASYSEPIQAVEAFLKTHPEFVQDRERERLLLSYYRGGYLKRIK